MPLTSNMGYSEDVIVATAIFSHIEAYNLNSRNLVEITPPDRGELIIKKIESNCNKGGAG